MSKFNQDEKKIREALMQIPVRSDGLAEKVKRRLHDDSITPLPGRKPYRPFIIAAVLTFVLALTVAASGLGTFRWFILRFNPSFGDIVEPVEIYTEDQGIRMEIIGAQKYENQAVVYLSLQDTSGQNRLTQQTDFRDGFNVKTKNPAQGNPLSAETIGSISWQQTQLYFDKENNTVYYEFTITASANSPLYDPLTLGSYLIYFDKISYESEPVAISLSNLKRPQTIAIKGDNIIGGSGYPPEEETGFALRPGYYLAMPHDDLWISNIGYIDGKLHVQTAGIWGEEFGSDDFHFTLRHTNGSTLDYDYGIRMLADETHDILSMADNAYDNAKYKYAEIVFTVDKEDLKDYTLCFTGSYYTGVEGTWKMSVFLNDMSHWVRAWKNERSIEGHLFEYLNLTPLGLQVIGSYDRDECVARDMAITVETIDGEVLLRNYGGSSNVDSNTFSFYWKADTPLDIAQVTAIVIDGVRIPVE